MYWLLLQMCRIDRVQREIVAGFREEQEGCESGDETRDILTTVNYTE